MKKIFLNLYRRFRRSEATNNQFGFTLVEILVVVSILAIVSGLGVSIFSSLLRSYNKTQIINELEQNGNFVLSIMEQQIRNAVDAQEITNGIEIELRDGSTKQFEYVPADCSTAQNGYIRDDSGNTLTRTNAVSGVNVTSASFNVSQADIEQAKVVDISISLTQGCSAPSRLDYEGQVHMDTTVLVRGGYE